MGPVYGGGGASAGWDARAAGKALAGEARVVSAILLLLSSLDLIEL